MIEYFALAPYEVNGHMYSQPDVSFRNASIFEIGLRQKAARALWTDHLTSPGIKTLFDLVQQTEWEVFHIPGIGYGYLNDIKNRLAERGLMLGMKVIELRQ